MKWKKLHKESCENNPRFKMMEDDESVYAEIAKTFGKDVSEALREYCGKTGLEPSTVAYSLKTDGNGQNPWEKFDNWMKHNHRTDFDHKFRDKKYDYDAEIRQSKKRRETMDVDVDDFEKKMAKIRKGFGGKKSRRGRRTFKESLGMNNTPNDVIDFICGAIVDDDTEGYVQSFDYDDYEPVLYLDMKNGQKFKVTVEEISED